MELISNNNFIVLTEYANGNPILIPVDNIGVVVIDPTDNVNVTSIFLKSDASTSLAVKETVKEILSAIQGE